MKRFIEKDLLTWKDDLERKPLILTGARQVGKSYVIEKNIAPSFESLLVVNFERQPQYRNCFESDLIPKDILRRIEALSGRRVNVGKTLIFFDEIQFCPKALTSLRYFYEEMPSLHLIAAGSLLEFVVDNISVPVGRVTYRHLSPLSFEEFLFNSGNTILLEELRAHPIQSLFPKALHEQLILLLKEYVAIGGMPKVVASYLKHHDYLMCQELLSDLLESYERDFPKYSRKDSDIKYIDTVFSRVPHLIGQQFKFVQISRDIQAKYLRRGLELLIKADVVTPIYRTKGIPLGANYDSQRFKLLFLDIGLMQRACGLDISRWITEGYALMHGGALAEQFVGQEISAHGNFRREKLYYWARDKRGSSAEVDYVVDCQGRVFPIEVKAGTTGTLKSIHLFLESYDSVSEGVKVSLDNFGRHHKIQSIPLYAFGTWLDTRSRFGNKQDRRA